MKDHLFITSAWRSEIRRLTVKERGWLLSALIDHLDGVPGIRLKGRESAIFEGIRAADAEQHHDTVDNPDYSDSSTERTEVRPDYFLYPFKPGEGATAHDAHNNNNNNINNNNSSNSMNPINQENQNDNKKKCVMGLRVKEGVQGKGEGEGGKFVPPTLEEVSAYIKQRGSPVDPLAFWHFYNSKNWMVGKTKMQRWKSSVIVWEQKIKKEGSPNGNSNNSADSRPAYQPLPGERYL